MAGHAGWAVGTSPSGAWPPAHPRGDHAEPARGAAPHAGAAGRATGTADGTAAAVRRAHPDILLIAARRNLGAVGRNLAVRRVSTPYVAFCDDDTWWEPGSLPLAADVL